MSITQVVMGVSQKFHIFITSAKDKNRKSQSARKNVGQQKKLSQLNPLKGALFLPSVAARACFSPLSGDIFPQKDRALFLSFPSTVFPSVFFSCYRKLLTRVEQSFVTTSLVVAVSHHPPLILLLHEVFLNWHLFHFQLIQIAKFQQIYKS